MPTDPEKQQCSLLLFVATSSEEKAVRDAAKDRQLPFERIREGGLEYYWTGNVGDERVITVRAEGMGPLGRGGSADLALRYGQITGASKIVQVGMAFGVRPKNNAQRYGDVLVSSSLIPYDNRDVVPHDKKPYDVRYDRAIPQNASRVLLEMFLREKARGGHTYGVHFGALLSGGARISSRAFRDELVGAIPPGDDQIVGGEMEGIGLLAAADEPVWCVVKGILDFADEDRDNVVVADRPIACKNAADFVFSALTNDTRGVRII